MAHSTDGGTTFDEPVVILETWGPINSASANGQYAIVYRVGTESTQQLAVAVSSDNGQSWTSSIANGNIPVYFDTTKSPGINIASDGTIDMLFYAHDGDLAGCVQNIEMWRNTFWSENIDTCNYNVYYTYSSDSGATFSQPIKLNQTLVKGESFTRFNGTSSIGSHLSITSTDDVVYPIWIGTPADEKTQVFTVRIDR